MWNITEGNSLEIFNILMPETSAGYCQKSEVGVSTVCKNHAFNTFKPNPWKEIAKQSKVEWAYISL